MKNSFVFWKVNRITWITQQKVFSSKKTNILILAITLLFLVWRHLCYWMDFNDFKYLGKTSILNGCGGRLLRRMYRPVNLTYWNKFAFFFSKQYEKLVTRKQNSRGVSFPTIGPNRNTVLENNTQIKTLGNGPKKWSGPRYLRQKAKKVKIK